MFTKPRGITEIKKEREETRNEMINQSACCNNNNNNKNQLKHQRQPIQMNAKIETHLLVALYTIRCLLTLI